MLGVGLTSFFLFQLKIIPQIKDDNIIDIKSLKFLILN